MNFLRLNHFLQIINNYWNKKHTISHMAASGRAMCHADISTRSAFADVSMTQSMLIKSTGRWPGQWGPHVSLAKRPTGGPHASGLTEKGKRAPCLWVLWAEKAGCLFAAQQGSTRAWLWHMGRLGSAGQKWPRRQGSLSLPPLSDKAGLRAVALKEHLGPQWVLVY